jgi:hypothetical protein
VRPVSPIGSATGGSGNLSDSLSNVARLAAYPKFVWVFNANCDETIIYNDPVLPVEFYYEASIFQLPNSKLVAVTTSTVIDVSVVVSIYE